jgi:hypothetical protein
MDRYASMLADDLIEREQSQASLPSQVVYYAHDPVGDMENALRRAREEADEMELLVQDAHTVQVKEEPLTQTPKLMRTERQYRMEPLSGPIFPGPPPTLRIIDVDALNEPIDVDAMDPPLFDEDDDESVVPETQPLSPGSG